MNPNEYHQKIRDAKKSLVDAKSRIPVRGSSDVMRSIRDDASSATTHLYNIENEDLDVNETIEELEGAVNSIESALKKAQSTPSEEAEKVAGDLIRAANKTEESLEYLLNEMETEGSSSTKLNNLLQRLVNIKK